MRTGTVLQKAHVQKVLQPALQGPVCLALLVFVVAHHNIVLERDAPISHVAMAKRHGAGEAIAVAPPCMWIWSRPFGCVREHVGSIVQPAEEALCKLADDGVAHKVDATTREALKLARR